MDIFRLPLTHIDFSQVSLLRWRVRRFFIGYMLFMYYAYAFLFFFIVAIPEQDIFGFHDTTYTAHQEAMPNNKTINLQDNEQHPPDKTAEKNNQNDKKAVPPLILMVGFVGGVFFITRTFVRTTQKFHGSKVEGNDVAAVWYLTRPIQSALMAIFIYYAFRGGQLVFYSMEGAPSEDQINVFTLSLLAIVASAFSEQAFEKLHSIATNIFKVEQPKD